jgi:P4 family phage/plasmid primase-like protien
VSPVEGCPLWLDFLDRVTNGDKDLQAYLRRMAGYCLTAITTEHVLFFLYGTGAKGKSVFISTLTGIAGDYAAISSMETFVETQSDRHPTELGKLQGARLVVAHESEKGRNLAEAKIKTLTGGDKITARFIRQDFFEYTPVFKLTTVGNHKPSLASVDEAIRRRIHLTPFMVTIPTEERDPELAATLKAEWPGILQWAVDGCLEWQRFGLAPPPVVRAATEEYLAQEDSLARWIEECCVTGRQHWGIGAKLWESWKSWAKGNNEELGTRKAFAQALQICGHPPCTSQYVRGYDGIDLLPNTAEWSDRR